MRLLAVDGNSIINRAFYGIRALTNSKGVFTNGVYGFLNILFKFIDEEQPDGICVAFDLRAPTFRHKEYDAYKAQRKGMPDELASQMPILKEVLGAMKITCLSLEGYEADDIIGTLSDQVGGAGHEVIILTGDKDDLQLICKHTTVRLTVTKKGRPEVVDYDEAMFREVYGFEPELLIDLKGLMGDSSDNIPGVPGVGEKTAMDLVQKYGTVEQLYETLDTLPLRPALIKKLQDGRDKAFLSKRLATICKDVPLEISMEQYVNQPWDGPVLQKMFTELEFRSFLERFSSLLDQPVLTEEETVAVSDGAQEAIKQIAEADELYVALDAQGLSLAARDVFFFPAQEEDYADVLQKLAASPAKKIVHDQKTALGLMEQELSNVVFDTMIGGYLLSASSDDYGTDALSERLLSVSGLPAAEAVRRLYPVMEKALSENGQDKLYYEMELPLTRVLYDMERIGIQVDQDALLAFGSKLEQEIARLQNAIYGQAGGEFNINSPKQLGKILFEDLGLPVVKKTKTGYSTNADVLEKLRPYHEIIDMITAYRTAAKLKSTYVDGLLKVVSPTDGRVHSTFNQTVTVTGRISSTEPNLQNIPVRDEQGRELRRMFVARDGCVLVDADYSQIELRVLAHMANDETMIEAFRSGMDIHTITASQVFGVSPEDVTPLLRRRAKAVNFGIVYGIGEFSLSQDIGSSVKEAKEYIAQYFARYPAIKDYFDNVKEQAKEDGYVTTMYGRRRDLPELKASNFNIRSFGERVAMNTPIQGSAADIIKIAMVRVHQRLEQEKMETRLILQVHDELILEAPIAEREKAERLLQEEMEQAAQLSAPLLAEVKSGKSWYETK